MKQTYFTNIPIISVHVCVLIFNEYVPSINIIIKTYYYTTVKYKFSLVYATTHAIVFLQTAKELK